MVFSWLRQLLPGVCAKKSDGKNLRMCCLTRCSCVPVVLLFFCSVFCGVFCEASTVASVPIGFEVNASDRDKIWVSENGAFAFGFLEVDGDGGDEYWLGLCIIWVIKLQICLFGLLVVELGFLQIPHLGFPWMGGWF